MEEAGESKSGQGVVMSDGSKAMPSGQGALFAPSLVFTMPTPCALVDSTGRVEIANAAWTSHQERCVPLASPGGNLIEALVALPSGESAAVGLRELLGGRRTTFTCDVCVNDQQDA